MPSDSLKISQPDTGFIKVVTDTHRQSILKPANNKVVKDSKNSAKTLLVTQPDSIQTDSSKINLVVKEEPVPNAFELYPILKQSNDSAVVNLPDASLKKLFSSALSNYTGDKALTKRMSNDKGWISGIILLIVLILVITRLYFQKYLSPIFASVFNIQVAEKLLREKSVLVRRVFFLLNLVFLLSSSLFIYLCILHFNIQIPIQNKFLVFLSITGLLFLFLVIRLVLQNTVGIIFESTGLFKEFIHNTYLINKNLGLYILPMVISVFYLKQPFAEIIFYISGGLIVISQLYRYIRALQIILKQNVFLLYSILYLCTLEILPALVGIKFVLSLR